MCKFTRIEKLVWSSVGGEISWGLGSKIATFGEGDGNKWEVKEVMQLGVMYTWENKTKYTK